MDAEFRRDAANMDALVDQPPGAMEPPDYFRTERRWRR